MQLVNSKLFLISIAVVVTFTTLLFFVVKGIIDNSTSDSRTILVIGSDERIGKANVANNRALNDLNLVVHFPKHQPGVDIINVPRDLVINFEICEDIEGFNPNEFANYSQLRLGIALEMGGVECVKRAISEVVDVKFDDWVVINFRAVTKITDYIGGVKICMPSKLIHYQSGRVIATKGLNTLTGQSALDFVRERKTIGDGSNLVRSFNQQVFIRNLLIKIREKGFQSDPVKMFNFIRFIFGDLKLSNSLKEIGELIEISNLVLNLNSKQIHFYSLPVKYGNRGSALTLDTTKNMRFLKNLFTQNPVRSRILKANGAALEKDASGYFCGVGSTRGKFVPTDIDTDEQRRILDELMKSLKLSDKDIIEVD